MNIWDLNPDERTRADWEETFDREDTNPSDGKHFWGIDNEDGTTTWYDDNGDLDSIRCIKFKFICSS